MAKVKIGTLSNPDTRLDKNSGNAIAKNAVALALESLIPNYLAGKSAEAFKRSTDKLIVKNKSFVDFSANVHVFSNGIFSGPDGLMMPTDKNATGGTNYNGIFFRLCFMEFQAERSLIALYPGLDTTASIMGVYAHHLHLLWIFLLEAALLQNV